VKELLPRLSKQSALRDFHQRIAALVEQFSIAGAIIDLSRFRPLKDEIGISLERSTDLVKRLAGTYGMPDFIPTNDGHIRELLYERIGLEVIRKTEGGLPAVDKGTLTYLRDKHAVVGHLLDYAKSEKLWSINGKGLEGLIKPCGLLSEVPIGWLPFHINPLGARTGRRASNNPNSQNWPRSVRGIVRSRWPDGRIGDHDYQKLEIVLLAWAAGCERLYLDFTEGGGYIAIAADLFGTSVEKDTPLCAGPAAMAP